MAKDQKKNAPHITKTHIERYLELEDQRKQLNREATALAKQAEEIEKEIEEFVRINGGKQKTIIRSGYILAIKQAKGKVPWKTEFVKLAGLIAAEELTSAAPPREFLSVEKA